MLLSKYMRLNCQILSPISETPELNGMKNFAIQNRVLHTTEGPRTTEARTTEVLLYKLKTRAYLKTPLGMSQRLKVKIPLKSLIAA